MIARRHTIVTTAAVADVLALAVGGAMLKPWAVVAGARDGRVRQAPATLPASVSGRLTFCVGGADLNGNRCAWRCAPLTIT